MNHPDIPADLSFVLDVSARRGDFLKLLALTVYQVYHREHVRQVVRPHH